MAIRALLLCTALSGCGGVLIPIPIPIPLPAAQPQDRMAEGHGFMASGDAEAALEAYRQAAVTGSGADALASMGTASLALGRLGQAERLLRRATETAPEDAAAWNNLGVVLLETGRHDEARAAFRRAVALDDGVSGVRDNLASVEDRVASAVTSGTSTPAAEPGRPAAPR